MNMNRRRFLFGLGASAAIVQATNIMPISVWDRPPRLWQDGVHDDSPYLNWLVEQAFIHGKAAVILPLGTLYMGGPIKMPYDNFRLTGNGSRLVLMNDVPAVRVTGNRNYLSDLDVERDGGGTSFVEFDRGSEITFSGRMEGGPVRRRFGT